MIIQIPATAQGVATLASDEDMLNDEVGFTNPNLHRRVDPALPSTESDEVRSRSYQLTVSTTDSYRTTQIYYHDEDSETQETP